MMKSFFLLLCVFVLACQQVEKKQLVTIQNRYSLELPDYLTQTTDLNEDASLQYKNSSKDLNVIVIDESKAAMQKVLEENNLLDQFPNDLGGYANILLEDLTLNINSVATPTVIDTLINGMPAKVTTVSGILDGTSLFYSVGFIEGAASYYQVMAWTLAEKQAEYQEQMKRIIYSLKEK
jgi:hypothetical protein